MTGTRTILTGLYPERAARTLRKRSVTDDTAQTGPEAASHKACGLDLEVVRDFAAFEALENDWNSLFQRAGQCHQLFQTYSWNWHWCQSYLVPDGADSDLKLSVVVGRRDGRVVMIWPLITKRHMGVGYICWMGAPVSQYSDVIIEDAPEKMDWMNASWRFICADLAGDMVCIPKVREDSVLWALLQQLGVRPDQETEAPYADLAKAGTYDVYASRFSSRQRKNRRRQRRRLSEHGEISFEVLKKGPAAAAAAQQAIDMKRLWLEKQALVSKAFSDRRIDAFFSSALASGERPAGCEVGVLKVGDETAAIEIGVACNGRLASHICVYSLDQKFVQSGAGGIVTDDTIRHCLDGDIDTFDLMAPADPYKYEWTDAAVKVCDYAVPLTSRGHAYAALGACTYAAKAAFETAPQRLRRVFLNIIGRKR